MLAVFQFPISDARPFAPDNAGRLDQPDWPPSAGFKPQFVRYFGPARKRWKGADEAWTDERTYCNAARALRFPELPSQSSKKGGLIGEGDLRRYPRCAFRRLFSDGRVVTRVEVGIVLEYRTDDPWWSPPATLDLERALCMVGELMELEASVPRTFSGEARGPLILRGSPLAALYGRASTRDPKENLGHARKHPLVEEGRPLIFLDLERERSEPVHWPEGFTRVDPDSVCGADLAFGWLDSHYGPVGVWILAPGKAKPAGLRSLRLCLLRLHAEQEALDLVLKQLRRQRLRPAVGEQEFRDLEDYLNKSTRLINRSSWGGVSQSAILQAFDASHHEHFSKERAELTRRYEGARKQVWKKIEAYEVRRQTERSQTVYHVNIEKMTMVKNEQNISGGTFHGPVINHLHAKRIENSFNTFAAAEPEAELTEAVSTLHEEVTALLQELEAEGEEASASTEEVVNQLETFTEQAAKPKPLKEVLEVTAKGLVDAAGTVAKMAGPVTKAVTRVLKILGVVGLL